jgi:hypothetical protein
MKKHSILVSLGLILLTSCTGILDTAPRSQISDNNMWTTPSLSKAGVDGLMYTLYRHKDGLSTIVPSDGSGGFNRIGLEGMGYTSILDDSNHFLKNATKKASGLENSSEWRSMYNTIHACNRAIAHLDRKVVGDKLYEQYICEARMIRAFCYTRLVMLFGEVPVYLEEVQDVDCTKSQTVWDDCWAMIIKECTECIDNDGFQVNNFAGDRLYKPSKGMAYALRGNAYMWLAADKNPEIYPDGTSIGAARIKEYYCLAAADFAQVKACGFGLWQGKWEDLFSYSNEHNQEMIFPLEFTFTDGFSSIWQWVIGARSHLNSWTRLVPSTAFVDDFEWSDGRAFNWADVLPGWSKLTEIEREVFFLRDSLKTFSKYVEEGTDVEKYITLSGQLEKVISRIGQETFDAYYLDLGNEARLRTGFDGRDPRLDKVVVTPYKKYQFINETSLSAIDFQLRWPRFKRQDGVEDSDLFPEFASNMVYLWNKGIVNDGSTLDRNYDGTDWPLIRFTEIQLMWAEALLGSDNPGDALNLLNEVRTRAGMPPFPSQDPVSLLNEIRYESRVELCLEGKDFFNEIRWNTFKEKKFQGKDFWDPRSCWNSGGWKTGYYYVEHMWPLSAPLDEIVMNSNLKKRPWCWTY